MAGRPRKGPFSSYFERDTNGCLIYTGNCDRDGYGIWVFKGKPYPAHRIAFRLWKGVLGDDEIVRHTCGNASCSAPEHLRKEPRRKHMTST